MMTWPKSSLVGSPVVLGVNAKALKTLLVIGVQIKGILKEHVCHCIHQVDDWEGAE